jgi:hypothetical protein
MEDIVPGPVVVATLATLLLNTLEQHDAEHLAGRRLRTDLRALNTRAEAEISASNPHLALARFSNQSV